MRPIESLVLVANLLALLALGSRLSKTVPWERYVPPAVPFVAGVQVVVEGARWQMAPAYALAAALSLTWLLRRKARPRGPLTAPRAGGFGMVLALLGLAISFLLPIALPVFRFATPTGPYGIGTITYHWIDSERQELFSTDSTARRELMVQIWYPAGQEFAAPRAPYLPNAERVTSTFAQIHRQPRWLLQHLKFVTTNAVLRAPIADGAPHYPVLIYLTGLTGFRQMNTFQVEELVSHGYIVVGVDQPYTAASVSFPDGRYTPMLPLELLQPLIGASYKPLEVPPELNGRPLPEGGIVRHLAQDVVFVLNRLTRLNEVDPEGILTGRMDLQRVGAFGVSLGGIVVAEACSIELRLGACLMMDAPMPTEVINSGLIQPSMWITRDADTMRLERQRAGGWPEEEIEAHLTTMWAAFEASEYGYFVQVPGTFHSNFTDVPKWFPLASQVGIAGPISPERAHAIINAYSLAFFDRHLKGETTERFAALRMEYAEVELTTR